MALLYQNMLGFIYPKHTPGATCSDHGVIFLRWSCIVLLTSKKSVLFPSLFGLADRNGPYLCYTLIRLAGPKAAQK